MDISSHIQMPRCVLKRFEDSNHRLFYFDVQKGIIGTNGHAKSINTQKGYYSQETEEFLKNNIEDPLSRLLESLDTIDFDSDISGLSTLDITVFFTYIYSLISRSPTLLNMLDSSLLKALTSNEQEQHDFTAKQGIILAVKKHILKDFHVNYFVNKSTKPFVLSTLGMYSFIWKKKLHLVSPISPNLAVDFIRDKSNPNVCNILNITNEEMIYKCNKSAFNLQCKENNGYIVAPKREVLEEQINN